MHEDDDDGGDDLFTGRHFFWFGSFFSFLCLVVVGVFFGTTPQYATSAYLHGAFVLLKMFSDLFSG